MGGSMFYYLVFSWAVYFVKRYFICPYLINFHAFVDHSSIFLWLSASFWWPCWCTIRQIIYRSIGVFLTAMFCLTHYSSNHCFVCQALFLTVRVLYIIGRIMYISIGVFLMAMLLSFIRRIIVLSIGILFLRL